MPINTGVYRVPTLPSYAMNAAAARCNKAIRNMMSMQMDDTASSCKMRHQCFSTEAYSSVGTPAVRTS